jgi:hypothetical protein
MRKMDRYAAAKEAPPHSKPMNRLRASVVTFLILLASQSLVACAGANPRDMAFADIVPGVEIGTGLELEVVEEPRDINTGESIALLLMNRTNTSISFEPGFGSRLFVYVEEELAWMEIPNKVEYIGDEYVLEPRVPDLTSEWAVVVSVAPDFEGIEQPESIRVLVVGRAIENATPTRTRIGAFIDVALSAQE